MHVGDPDLVVVGDGLLDVFHGDLPVLHGEQVAFFIAKHIRSNVRELEGALKRVIAYSSFHGQEITLTVAKEAASRRETELDEELRSAGRQGPTDPTAAE